ncbi:hypothetical protein [Empedobacter tilapiae]
MNINYELFTTAQAKNKLPEITLINNQEELKLIYKNFSSERGKSAPIPFIDFDKNNVVVLYKEQLSDYDIKSINQSNEKIFFSLSKERNSAREMTENSYVIIIPKTSNKLNLIIN